MPQRGGFFQIADRLAGRFLGVLAIEENARGIRAGGGGESPISRRSFSQRVDSRKVAPGLRGLVKRADFESVAAR